MPHHFLNIFPHVRCEVFHNALDLNTSAWLTSEYNYVPLLLRTKMKSLEATSLDSMGASGELSFVKLFCRQILYEENRGTRLSRRSWRNLTRDNIDIVLPNSSIRLIPWNQQQGRFIHRQSPLRPSLSRQEPSCTQLPCGEDA